MMQTTVCNGLCKNGATFVTPDTFVEIKIWFWIVYIIIRIRFTALARSFRLYSRF